MTEPSSPVAATVQPVTVEDLRPGATIRRVYGPDADEVFTVAAGPAGGDETALVALAPVLAPDSIRQVRVVDLLDPPHHLGHVELVAPAA